METLILLFTNHIWKHDACQTGHMAMWCNRAPSIMNTIIVNQLEETSKTQQSIKLLQIQKVKMLT